MASFVHNVNTVMIRELRPTLRAPVSLIFTLLQPLILLGLFAPLLGSFDQAAAVEGSTLQWFVPGVLVMIIVFGTTGVGSGLLFEMQSGSHERMLVTPLRRSSLIIGRALKELAPTIAQAILVLALVTPFGFRLDPLGALLGLAILGLLGIGIGALSYTLGILVRKQDWIFWIVTQTLTFPLLILSGLLLPIETAPGWMQAAAQLNPMSYVVAAERALFTGTFPPGVVLAGAAAAAITAIAGLALGVCTMRRSSS